jgi:RNA polymerase sigma-70 factor (ECF subfamily)
LRRFGVREADLDDLCQEVFIVVHDRRDQLDSIDNVPYWLRTICWKVAAGFRRRAYRHREVSVEAPPEGANERATDTFDIELQHEQTRLLEAIDQLDDSLRDLVALHDLGDLPLVDLAELTGCDRRTVHKRLMLAHRRLAALLRDGSPRPPLPTPVAPSSVPPDAASPESWLGDRLQVIAVTRDVNIGVVGNTILTVWPATASLAAMEALWDSVSFLVENFVGRFTYLATVTATVRPPPLDARKKIIELLKTFGHVCDAYGTALEGGMSWIARPIMTGLAAITRPAFPMRFLSGLPAASQWLAPYTRGPAGSLPAEALVTAVTHLRRLEADSFPS